MNGGGAVKGILELIFSNEYAEIIAQSKLWHQKLCNSFIKYFSFWKRNDILAYNLFIIINIIARIFPDAPFLIRIS